MPIALVKIKDCPIANEYRIIGLSDGLIIDRFPRTVDGRINAILMFNRFNNESDHIMRLVYDMTKDKDKIKSKILKERIIPNV